MIGANTKIAKLLEAIAEHEGWHPIGSTQSPNGSRSYRNHNPGNLRKSPYACTHSDGFAVFRSDFEGWCALEWDIMQKAHGNTVTGLTGASTLREFVFVWAPPSDNNDSEAYLAAVTKKTGMPEGTTLAEIFAM